MQRIHADIIIICILAALGSFVLPLPLSTPAHLSLAILILAAGLWMTEALPLFVTALMLVPLVVLTGISSLKHAIGVMADPILLLFFCGFLIAQAMKDVHLDVRIGHVLMQHFRDDRYALLGLMGVTAFLSMWISNTATAVIMIPIALGVVRKFRKMPNFTKAAVLGIAYSANIGGMGTIIGSPPNAIIAGQLAQTTQVPVSFLGWMISMAPMVVVLILAAWMVLVRVFPFEHRIIHPAFEDGPLRNQQKEVLLIGCATIILWLTTPLHNIPNALVALLGVIALFLRQHLSVKDLSRIEYSVLILIAGGLLLGHALFTTGLSAYFGEQIGVLLAGKSLLIIAAGVALFSVALSTFASNTATAALLVPIIISLSEHLTISPMILSLVTMVAVSCSFLLPVSTPPNALAYATGNIKTRDMLKAGILLVVLSVGIIVLAAQYFWPHVPFLM